MACSRRWCRRLCPAAWRQAAAALLSAFCYNEQANGYYALETALWPLVRVGERLAHSLGPVLVCLVLLLTASVVLVFYTCLLPIVYFESRLRCLLHLVLGHWLLVNVVFHYYCAAFSDPGAPPAGRTFPVVGICRKCVAPKPARAHHCSVCRRCVLRMDHHCPWLNSCVGLYNYKHFLLFCAFMLFGSAYVVLVAAPIYYQHFVEADDEQEEAPDAGLLASAMHRLPVHSLVYYELVLSSAVALVLLLLTGYHAYLAGRNETSIETHINRRMAKAMAAKGLVYRNPYDLGLWRNWRQALCIDSPGRSFWRHVLLPSACPPSSDGLSFETTLMSLDEVISDISAA